MRLLFTAALLSLSLASLAAAEGKRPTRTTPSTRAFVLFDAGTWAEQRRLVEALAQRTKGSVVNLTTVLGDTNREATWQNGRVRLFRDEAKRKRRTYPASGSLIFDRDDSLSTNWYPQGVTGSGDATPTGTVAGGKRALAVSWYPRRTPEKGARISFVDISDARKVTYRHVLLVEPFWSDRGADFRPVMTHAGGIVLYRNLLYVADTHWGVRVFDTERMLRASHDPKKLRVGVSGGKAYAFNYRYVLPMVGRYRQFFPTDIRYSFVSLDRTRVPHSLWVGEYESGANSAYAARFALDPSTAQLVTERPGQILSNASLRINRERTQGFVAAHGSYYFDHSYARDQYRLHVQTPTGYRSIEAGYGLEDMYYDPTRDRLWMLSEHPKSRMLFYIDKPDEL